MKVGLVPQVAIYAQRPRQSLPYVPLGLLCIAGALDRTKYDVEIVDLTRKVISGEIEYNEMFDEEAARFLASEDFDVVGFSSFSSAYHHTLKVATLLKKISPKTKIVFGGPQATFCDIDTIENFSVDYIVRGEGEITFPILLDALNVDKAVKEISGITYRDGLKAIYNEPRELIGDIDTLPFPAYDLYPMGDVRKIPIEGTRGCPYKCVYCATSIYWRRIVRNKSPERIINEIKLLKNKYSTKSISFADDTFAIDRKKTEALCNAMISENINVNWMCSTRIDSVDKKLLALMSRAGCKNIFYGIESGSPKIQKSIKKQIKLNKVIDNIKLTAESGIKINASFMMGFPDETEDDLRLTLELTNKIKLLFPDLQTVQLHMLAPDINTEIANEYRESLEYDGFRPDHVGGAAMPFDKDLILKHKDIFLSYYYFQMRHVSRNYIKSLHNFVLSINLVSHWATLFIMLNDKDPLVLFKGWMKFNESFKLPPEVPPNSPEQMVALVSVMNYLNKYTNEIKSLPLSIQELYKHELEQVTLKGMIIIKEEMRKKAASGDVLSTKEYSFDPDKTIDTIRHSIKSIGKQKPSPIKMEYYQSGTDEIGPRILFRKHPCA